MFQKEENWVGRQLGPPLNVYLRVCVLIVHTVTGSGVGELTLYMHSVTGTVRQYMHTVTRSWVGGLNIKYLSVCMCAFCNRRYLGVGCCFISGGFLWTYMFMRPCFLCYRNNRLVPVCFLRIYWVTLQGIKHRLVLLESSASKNLKWLFDLIPVAKPEEVTGTTWQQIQRS